MAISAKAIFKIKDVYILGNHKILFKYLLQFVFDKHNFSSGKVVSGSPHVRDKIVESNRKANACEVRYVRIAENVRITNIFFVSI